MLSGLNVLQQAVGWLHLLVAIAGVVVCAMGLQRTRTALVPLLGFGLEAFVSLGYRVASVLVGQGTDYTALGTLYLLLSFAGVVGAMAIVAGVAMLLREVGGAAKARPPAAG